MRTARVAELSGATLRQLQWWDERGIIAGVTRRGWERRYSAHAVAEVKVLVYLLRHGLSLQRARGVIRRMRAMDVLWCGGFLLTDGKRVTYARTPVALLRAAQDFPSAVWIVDLNKTAAGTPMKKNTEAA